MEYTPEQIQRQEERKAKKLRRKQRKENRDAARQDHVLIVSHKGLPHAFNREQLGSFVFQWEQREEVLGKLSNPEFKPFEGYCDWETDTYTSSNGQRHLWKLPHTITAVQQ